MIASLRTTNFMNKGLDLNVNYTWSHSIDNISTTFSENNNNFNLGYLDPYNPALDRGPSDYDIRNRVVVSGIWSIPAMRDQHGFLGRIAGGWQIAPIFEARTGTPFTIWDGTNAAQQTPRWDPGTGVASHSVTGNPVAMGPNVFNGYQLPLTAAGTVVGAGNPNDINPVVGISDFGPSCATLGSGAVSPCMYPSTMTSSQCVPRAQLVELHRWRLQEHQNQRERGPAASRRVLQHPQPSQLLREWVEYGSGRGNHLHRNAERWIWKSIRRAA